MLLYESFKYFAMGAGFAKLSFLNLFFFLNSFLKKHLVEVREYQIFFYKRAMKEKSFFFFFLLKSLICLTFILQLE